MLEGRQVRKTYISRDVSAGCFECHGSDPMWRGPNAQGVAARHHDAHGHTTWCDVYMSIRYGDGDLPVDEKEGKSDNKSG